MNEPAQVKVVTYSNDSYDIIAHVAFLSRLVAAAAALVIGLLVSQPVFGASEESASDIDVTFAVENAMLYDYTVPSNDIDVSTSEGVVTLKGTVNSILAKERAARLAESIRGARSVINQINVDALPQTDDEIRENVEYALLSDPAADSYEIKTRVNNGVVTLTGTVESWQEKELAVRVAKGVKGVKNVEDRMSVSYATERLDSEIEAEVRRALEIDAWVDERLIDVGVSNGKVTLSGHVGSAAERRRAVHDAQVMGVESVDIEELKVSPWAKDETRIAPKPAVKSDEWIRDAVKDAFLYDPRVASFEPEVSVNDGVVTLSGTVDNLKAKRAAERDASNTKGVRRIKNYLKVRLTEPVSDDKLEQRVTEALAWNPITESYEISVEASKGVVILNGMVDSYFEKSEADDVAQRTKGVVTVRNNLDVRDPTLTYYNYNYDPHWDYDPFYLVYGYNYNRISDYLTRRYTSDAEVKDDVEDELYWSPFVDSDKVTVSVNNGTVTLTGTVDSWNEYYSAAENAYEGGAEIVINDLTVQ